MAKVLVIAPHPDDETLGCGGTLLKHRAAGDEIHWCIVTKMTAETGFLPERIAARDKEIHHVSKKFGFSSIHQLDFSTTRLDISPLAELVSAMSAVFSKLEPNIVYVPFPGDAHSDHKITFAAATACSKWFRYPSVKKVLAYETLSETDFGLDPQTKGFHPNVFVDVSQFIQTKLKIIELYAGEFGKFPFPRSIQAVRALAEFRGASSGSQEAEAFVLLREIL